MDKYILDRNPIIAPALGLFALGVLTMDILDKKRGQLIKEHLKHFKELRTLSHKRYKYAKLDISIKEPNEVFENLEKHNIY